MREYSYLVVWRGDEEEYHQSEVILSNSVDPGSLSEDEWVAFAAVTEGYSDNEVRALVKHGYSLIVVCDFPRNFYV